MLIVESTSFVRFPPVVLEMVLERARTIPIFAVSAWDDALSLRSMATTVFVSNAEAFVYAGDCSTMTTADWMQARQIYFRGGEQAPELDNEPDQTLDEA